MKKRAKTGENEQQTDSRNARENSVKASNHAPFTVAPLLRRTDDGLDQYF